MFLITNYFYKFIHFAIYISKYCQEKFYLYLIKIGFCWAQLNNDPKLDLRSNLIN